MTTRKNKIIVYIILIVVLLLMFLTKQSKEDVDNNLKSVGQILSGVNSLYNNLNIDDQTLQLTGLTDKTIQIQSGDVFTGTKKNMIQSKNIGK